MVICRPKKYLTSLEDAALRALIEVFQKLRNLPEPAYCQLLLEVLIMEKAMPSEHYNALKTLLLKAYGPNVSEESLAVVDKYVEDGCSKMKRIIDTLN